MQTKHHATKNPHIFKQKQDLQGTIFVVERSLAEIVQILKSKSWNCIQYIFISRGFSNGLGIFQTGSK